ncbi:Long neurotoxin 1 [Varanus komodoensis]|nr:Long neurotoxin 1 [Varanus komodoensis]
MLLKKTPVSTLDRKAIKPLELFYVISVNMSNQITRAVMDTTLVMQDHGNTATLRWLVEKKAMVSKALATAFLALLSFDIAGAFLCIYCPRVATDNGCYTKQKTCNAGSNDYCYSRIILVVGALMCHYCQNVMPDNSCFPYLTTCDAESWKYCFTQMTTRAVALICNYCRNVQPNNVCRHIQKTCYAGKRKFCYSRLTVKGGHLQHVEYGCSGTCRTVRYKNLHKTEHYMLCCVKDRCNNQKFWKSRN